jgi:hypothetical protein
VIKAQTVVRQLLEMDSLDFTHRFFGRGQYEIVPEVDPRKPCRIPHMVVDKKFHHTIGEIACHDGQWRIVKIMHSPHIDYAKFHYQTRWESKRFTRPEHAASYLWRLWHNKD